MGEDQSTERGAMVFKQDVSAATHARGMAFLRQGSSAREAGVLLVRASRGGPDGRSDDPR